jgi:arsenate reductase-like glutaredoxin family protein
VDDTHNELSGEMARLNASELGDAMIGLNPELKTMKERVKEARERDASKSHFTKAELENMISQLPPGALPETEAALKEQLADVVKAELARSESLADIVDRMPDELLKPLPEGITVDKKLDREVMDGFKTVDLVMYVDGNRKIVGKATVIEGVVYSMVNRGEQAGEYAARMIEDGVIEAMSIGFIMRPVHPSSEYGDVREATMRLPFRDPPRKYPDMTPFLNDPDEKPVLREIKVPFKDKFPYGPK